jgi:hypothetical protein
MHDIKIQVLYSNTKSKLTKIYYSKKLETWKHKREERWN